RPASTRLTNRHLTASQNSSDCRVRGVNCFERTIRPGVRHEFHNLDRRAAMEHDEIRRIAAERGISIERIVNGALTTGESGNPSDPKELSPLETSRPNIEFKRRYLPNGESSDFPVAEARAN